MTTPPERPPRRPVKKRRRKIKVLPTILLILLVAFLICAVCVLAYVGRMMKDLPEWNASTMESAQTSFLYDRNGEYFDELHRGENRVVVSLDEMPQYLIDCFISTEDTRFYDHFGVDVYRIFGALIADLKAGSIVQGASTITMQLARNAILETQEKQLDRKVKEALLAIQIEKDYTKDEILEMYLNEIYFGHGCYGVEAASELFFGKNVQDITLEEAAVLTGVIRGWTIYSPLKNPEKSLEVRNQVLNNLIEYDSSYEEAATEAMAKPLVVATEEEQKAAAEAAQGEEDKKSSTTYGWFSDYVVDEAENILEELGMEGSKVYTGGLRIYTTMDPDIQEYMEELYDDDDLFPSSRSADQVQSAMVIMDHSNGQILGLVGGREYETKRGFNRATDMTRQPGSVFKPISVYAAALEAGYGPGSVVNDCPTTFGKNYSPSNYDGKWRGVISMRTAIQYSVNVPAVKFLQLIGIDAGYEMVEKLGITLDGDSDKGLALALGGLTHGVSPLEIAGAYGTFANGGVYNKPIAITRIENAKGEVIYEAQPQQTVAMSESTAYLITNMLETVTTSGTGTNARMNRPVASKTGTVQLPDKPEFQNITGNKDAWFAAYTPELVGVVWMGYDSDIDSEGNPQYLRQIYGGKYPAQLWKKVMTRALQEAPVVEFDKPSNIVSIAIDTKSGMLPSSLTPSEFIRQELWAKENTPERSDVWQKQEICSESGQLATEFCPNITTALRFTPPKESNTIKRQGADASLQVTSTKCTLHTTVQSNTTAVNICTDSRHGDGIYVANPRDGGGGCPADKVVTRYFTADNIPTQYCNLADHQPAVPITPPDNTDDDNPNDTNSGSDTEGNHASLVTPTSLSASASGSDGSYTAQVSWNDSNNSANTLYEVEYWSDSGSQKSVKTYFRNVEVKNLQGSTTYNFRVRAVNENTGATSSWTAAVQVTTGS